MKSTQRIIMWVLGVGTILYGFLLLSLGGQYQEHIDYTNQPLKYNTTSEVLRDINNFSLLIPYLAFIMGIIMIIGCEYNNYLDNKSKGVQE